ncbi:MAG TPA: GIY-YIG nuclease family protein [Candidatus Tumulicola sp.]|jgi:putative endonuclease
MLLCSDDSFYVGVSNDPDRRLWEHNAGLDERCYTYKRRPVRIVHSSEFDNVLQAIDWEKRLKSWSRAKKSALVNNDWPAIHEIVTAERRRREASSKPRRERCS